MEKLLYAFWHPKKSGTQLRDELVQLLGPQLKREQGVHSVQINVADEYFTPSEKSLQPIHRIQPGLQGVISLWVDSGYYRKPLEQRMRQHVNFHGYSVVESRPIASRQQASGGKRLDALSQWCFLTKPKHFAHQKWLSIWWDSHTQVAIDTQSTFQYAQHAVMRALTPNAPELHGIIEECFPPAAFTSPEIFFDAVGDKAKFERNNKIMMDSCARFVDFDAMDLIFTSQYVI
jgi:hypothetical protein